MTEKEFWKRYKKENILEIFDGICDFFSQKLSKEFTEKNDVVDVILEAIGHLETEKEFDKMVKFIELIKEKQPELYEDNFQYMDDSLINYYCFCKEHEKVEKSFSNFMSNPIHDYESFLLSFKKILFYGYTNLINKTIELNYKEVVTSEKLWGSASGELAISKFHITLEDLYQRGNNTGFDKNKFSEILQKYGFEFDEDDLVSIEKGMQEQISNEDIATAFLRDRNALLISLEVYFLKHMQKHNFPFALSGMIWNNFLVFWKDKNKKKNCKSDKYFGIKEKEFEKYLSSFMGFTLLDNRSELISVLWGSVYVYDFLKSIEIISEETFDDFLEVSRLLKAKVIANDISDLWNSNFVHEWEKPDSISTAEFIEEEKIFRKSILFKHHNFKKLRDEFEDELANMGELAVHIVKEGESDKDEYFSSLLESLIETYDKVENEEFDDDYFDDVEFEDENEESDYRKNNYEVIEPVRTEKKIGRNEPCPCGSGKKYKKCCGE